MKNIWNNAWKKCLIWFSGYFSFIAFAIVGGYTIVKNEDEELIKCTKTVFIVTLIFTAITAFLTIFSSFAGMSDNYYSSAAYDFYDICSKLVSVAKILVYAFFIVVELIRNKNSKVED